MIKSSSDNYRNNSTECLVIGFCLYIATTFHNNSTDAKIANELIMSVQSLSILHLNYSSKSCLIKVFVYYASIFSSILVKQKHWALFEHFSGLFPENEYFFSTELLLFNVTPFKRDENKKSEPFNRLSLESGNRKKVDMQRLSPRFRAQQFFLWEICAEMFSPNL